MIRYSLRSLLAHKLRLLLTVTAVTLGVAFVAGSFILSDTMGRAFDELFAGLAKGSDVTVRAQSSDPSAAAHGQTRPLDASVLQTVRDVPGVASAEGAVMGFALILDKNGQPIQPGGAPTLGSSVHADASLAGDFSYRTGAAPRRPDEVAMDAASARKAGYAVGDKVRIIFQDETGEFTISGTVGFGETDSVAGATMATFDMSTAQKLLGKPDKVDQVDVRAAPGVTAAELRDRISRSLPAGTQALTADEISGESSKSIRDGLQIFTNVLLAFAAVSLLVGSFVIWNTFNILVAQRRREVALLRAVGGTRRQILTGIVTEAVIVGLAASGIGLVAGIGLATGIRSLLGAIGIEVPTTAAVVEVRSVIAALLVGVVVTVAAAAIPALAATRVAPIEALRQATPAAGRIGRTRSVTGSVLLTAGAAALAVATAASNQPLVAGIGTLLAFAGLVVAGPHLARAIARLASHGRPGGAWSLASRNVARTPQRSSATAMALAVGLAVVCAVSVTAASTKASVTDLLSGGNRADLILKPAAVTGGLSPAVADLLRHQAGVDTVLEMRFSGANVNNVPISIAGVKPDDLDKVLDIGVTGGSSKDFQTGTVLLSTKQATALNAAVGDRITVTFPETGAKTLTIAATFERDSLIGAGYLLTLDDYAANVTSRLNAAILVKSAMGADSAALKERVGQAVAAYPNVKVSDPAEFGKAQQGSVDQMMGLVTALLAMAIIVAILGIINTLMLSVVERTRELGLMRAVGATKRQVRGVIRRESVLMSLFGALAGVGLGSAAGIALTRSMADQGIITLSFPFGTLAVYLVIATLIGVLAAIGPARRASRVDVLTAVTVD